MPWPDHTPVNEVLSARDLLTQIITTCIARGVGNPVNSQWGLIAGHALVCRQGSTMLMPPSAMEIHGNHHGGKTDDELWADVKAAHVRIFSIPPPTQAELGLAVQEIDHQGTGGPRGPE